MATLEELRARLDDIDRRVVAALAERQRTIDEVAESKTRGGPLRDPAREQALLERLLEIGQSEGLEPFVITRVYRELIEHSVRRQQVLLAGDHSQHRKVAYQGGPGAFSHVCAEHHFAAFGGTSDFVGYDDFPSMVASVRDGVSDYAVLPIENTIAGSINESYDLLHDNDLHIVGEEAQPIEHCLVALPGAALTTIERVYSHPVALLQCSRLLARLQVQGETYKDTALAVQKIKEEGDVAHAAIASAEAAAVHGLPVLQRGVQDETVNLTRMVIVAREARAVDLRVPCKTSLVFATRHRQGALARALTILAEHELNLVKLESRPVPSSPWKYRFYLDFDGNVAELRVQQALRELESETHSLRVLGSYAAKALPEGE